MHLGIFYDKTLIVVRVSCLNYTQNNILIVCNLYSSDEYKCYLDLRFLDCTILPTIIKLYNHKTVT